uniref:Tripartite motif containing 10 n=1 Tax=Pseudonaja textilis TaxID=8673 RepID=A0A670ZF85_PSETE
MAAAATGGSPLRDLCDEITCPICLESFKDPVTITTCGHNFCRACLSCYCQGTERGGVGTPCPQCRKTFHHGQNIIPNRPLANVVQIAEKFRRAEEENPGKANLCEKYHRPVKISCQHQTVLHCAICGTTKPHNSNHGSSTMQKANDVNKVSNIKFLLVWIRIASSPPFPLREQEKHKSRVFFCFLFLQPFSVYLSVSSLFKDLHHFLKEQEEQFLTQMVEAEEEITVKRDSFMAFFSQELSLYERIIQKIKNSQTGQNLLNTHLWWDGYFYFRLKLLSNITLDPNTAHPQITLFLDGKTAELGERCQELPNNPERFDLLAAVLGHEEFKEGRHFWEVNVESQKEWAVGICQKSVKRKDSFSLNTEEGVSMLGRWRGNYRFSLPPSPLPHIPDKKLKRIRVCLNCAAGKVSFFDAETGTLLYSTTSFPGENVLPFFWLGSYAQLMLLLLPGVLDI